jgi:hypothetical protein
VAGIDVVATVDNLLDASINNYNQIGSFSFTYTANETWTFIVAIVVSAEEQWRSGLQPDRALARDVFIRELATAL